MAAQGIWYSLTHKGTSYFWQKVRPDAPNAPATGDLDIMFYYKSILSSYSSYASRRYLAEPDAQVNNKHIGCTINPFLIPAICFIYNVGAAIQSRNLRGQRRMWREIWSILQAKFWLLGRSEVQILQVLNISTKPLFKVICNACTGAKSVRATVTAHQVTTVRAKDSSS